MTRRLRWRLFVTLGITALVSFTVAYPLVADRLGWSGPTFLLKNRLTPGLDLKGGVQFVLRVNVDEAVAAGSEMGRDDIVASARQTINRRVNDLGVVEPLIAVQGANRNELLVQLPGLTDAAHARAVLGKTARLEWKVVESGPATTREELEQRRAGRDDVEVLATAVTAEGGAPVSYYLVRRVTGLAGSDIRNAQATRDSYGQPSVLFSLTRNGSGRFATLTSANVGRQIAIVEDGYVRSAPVVEHAITGGQGTIVGRFSAQEAADLALVLRSGALPVSMTYLGGQYIGPSLGLQSIRAGLGASLAALVIVAAFMLLYYNRAGLNAIASLVINMVLLLGAMAWLGAAITLPGIAGLVLTIGMGLDSNVLIFERIKEELKGGRPVRSAVAAGFDRVFLTILDTHITSLIAAAFLFQFGTGSIRGFATMLSIGLLTNVFTAVFVSRTLFEATLSRGGASSLKLATFARSTARAPIDFLAWRHHAFTFSAAIVAAGLALTIMRGGLPLGLDFTGGTAVTARFVAPVSDEAVRRAIPVEATVQQYGALANHEMLIRLSQPPEGSGGTDIESGVAIVKTALAAAHLPAFQVTGTDMVGPSIGADMQRKGTYATIASLAGITAYIALRFRPAFALGAIVATVHDMAVTVSVLSVCGYDVSLNVVAALLTISGYSVNDTIVIFDRVREMLRVPRPGPVVQAVNAAINQTLSRTIITAGTTFLAVLALLLFGGEVLRGFAVAMLVGIVTGTYSTMFIASPIAGMLTRRRNPDSSFRSSNFEVRS